MGPAQPAVGRVYEYTSFIFACGFFLVSCLVFFLLFLLFLLVLRVPLLTLGPPGGFLCGGDVRRDG